MLPNSTCFVDKQRKQGAELTQETDESRVSERRFGHAKGSSGMRHYIHKTTSRKRNEAEGKRNVNERMEDRTLDRGHGAMKMMMMMMMMMINLFIIILIKFLILFGLIFTKYFLFFSIHKIQFSFSVIFKSTSALLNFSLSISM